MRRARTPLPPLDRAALERYALRYVERYATTRGKLAAYLTRKLRERGWQDDADPDPGAVAARMAELGYVDDRAFAEGRAAAMTRRGLGARRVDAALRHAGVGEADRASAAETVEESALAAAITFARRRRLGPFGQEMVDRAKAERQVAAMVRAGHDVAIARRILRIAPGEDVEAVLAQA